MKKIFASYIIFLFIGVAVAPSINTSVVTASHDDDLVEVTAQACGFKGYGDTTVKLTREQYQNLEQYLVDFRARLNQTTTRDETVPIFKEAVVELDKYGLLPRGMSVEQVQRLVIGKKLNLFYRFVEERLNIGGIPPPPFNIFCLLLIKMSRIMFVVHVSLLFYLLILFAENLGELLMYILTMSPITLSIFSLDFIYGGYVDIQSLGLLGKINYQDWADIYLLGFVGLKIWNKSTGDGYLFGWTGLIMEG